MNQAFQAARKPGLFYGYWVLIAAFLMVVIYSGAGLYAFSLFVKPLQAQMGWNRGEIMSANFIWSLLAGATGPFVGRFIQHFGARKVIFAGAVSAGLCFLFLSRIQSLWQFYLLYLVLGPAMAAIGYVPASLLVSNWFKKRRGLAIGLMSVGVGVAGGFLAPLIGGFIIPQLGWQTAYSLMGLAIIAFNIPLTIFVVRTSPSEKGLLAYGALPGEAVKIADKTKLSATPLKITLASPSFWLITVSIVLGATGQNAIFQSQVPYFQDIGFSAVAASAIYGAVGLVSGAGKLSFGWICDKIRGKFAWSAAMAVEICAVLILVYGLRPGATISIWAYSVMIGFSFGAWLPVMSILASRTFGLAAYGVVFGIFSFAFNFGAAVGPLISGKMYDASGSYHGAFLLSCVLLAASLAVIMFVRQNSPE